MGAIKDISCGTYELLITEKSLDGRQYRTYGIRLFYAGTEVSVEDLSLNREVVEELVERCNRLQLSPIHFKDVLEDFLES